MQHSDSTAASNGQSAGGQPDHTPSGDAEFPHRYTARLAGAIELHWQKYWKQHQTFRVGNPGEKDFDPGKPKFFCLDMFPYPSGSGLHVGHPEGYTATDIICRYHRHLGFNVLHPMGWDAFGLPAEQYAIQTGVHPAKTTSAAIDTFRRQLQRFGFTYDWSREFATIDPDYYKWTQWIWLQAYESWYDPRSRRGSPHGQLGGARPISELIAEFQTGDRTPVINPDAAEFSSTEKSSKLGPWSGLSKQVRRRIIDSYRLAYLAEQTVNWCPKLGTALANEEVIDGKSERGGYPVFRKPLRQWMFRITAYAQRLLNDLQLVSWPESTRIQQTEWIGRSEGADIDFKIDADAKAHPAQPVQSVRVFTTRPDTVFGATFLVVAPEHPLVRHVLAQATSQAETATLREYVERARNRSDVDRMATSKEKTGVPTGAYAVNPATGGRIPIWTSDYVLMGYGHGAIMAVPGHDERDFEFASTFNLEIKDVVYTHVLLAVREGCARLEQFSDAHEHELELLADFVGLCMNQGRTDYDEVWRMITARRAGPSVNKGGIRNLAAAASGPADNNRRGSISMIWRDTLETLVKGDWPRIIAAARSGHLIERLGQAVVEDGWAVNSANEDVSLNGLRTDDAKQRIVQWLASTGHGSRQVTFKLRDWLFSRQRYWGEPFPIVFDSQGNHYPIQEAQLPLKLPDMDDYQPVESDDPQPLLAKAVHWVNTTAGEAGVLSDLLPPTSPVRRETNTMPGWAGSCWYYLRFCDARNPDRFVGRQAERYWMLSSRSDGSPHAGGVDLYIGGSEHAVLHLLYARFWHKMLFDLGQVSTPEPFGRLFHQGLITSWAYQRADKSLVPVDGVEDRGEGDYVEIATGQPVTQIVAKMSKSLKNVVNPDDVIADYGADTFRLYEMYMGPLAASKPWNPRDIEGLFRFLARVWRLCVDEQTGAIRTTENPNTEIDRALHRVVAKVAGDIQSLSFNTAIAAIIEFTNQATKAGGLSADQLQRLCIVLSPFAPHIAEELWCRSGNARTLAYEPWPAVDLAMLRDQNVDLPVQVNGKVKGKLSVPADADTQAIEQLCLADQKVKQAIEGKTIKKLVIVPGKIINIVVA